MRSSRLAFLLLAVTACGGATASTPAPASPSAFAPAPVASAEERVRVPVDYAPARGARDAAVTIVVFSDLECPFCRMAVPTLERLEEEYAGRLRVVFRHYPLPMHPHARMAAAVTLEGYRQGGARLFWQLHDRLFAMESMEPESILHLAEQLGVDREQLTDALADGTHDPAIEADMALARTLGVEGTPSFFVNGIPIAGALPYEAFDAVVRAELARADEALARGVAPADLYTALTWSGRIPQAEPPARLAPPSAPSPARDTAVYRVPVTGDEPMRGAAEARVTIVGFSDFQCPFCQRVEPTLSRVVEDHPDVRVVWMNNPLPFHQNAQVAAEAALEVHRQQGDLGFWRFHGMLFENQRALSRSDLEGYASALGVDMDAFRAALDSHRHAATIEAQQNLAGSLGARGTPSFFINGRRLIGAQPYEAFDAAVEEARADARAAEARGVSRRDLYDALIADGRTSPQPSAEPSGRPEEDPNRVYELAIPADAARQGDRDAPILIQEISDLQCPFCSRVQPTIDRVLREFEGRVQVVWRDYPLPFHQNAPLAAEAAREVRRQRGDEAFFRYIGILFENQRELEQAKLVEYAGQIRGVNARRLRTALEQRTHRAAVEADIEAVRAAMGSIGTPTFLVDGRKVSGAQPYDRFREAVEEALRRHGQNP